MKRNYLSRESRKQLILDNAKNLIIEQGIVSFKFSSLSKLSNCSNSTLYDIFQCKEDIVVTIFINNLHKKLAFSRLIYEEPSLTYKEKFYIISTKELLEVQPSENNDAICNFFAINKFICNYAAPILTETSGRLLQQLVKIRALTVSNALKCGEISQEFDLANINDISISTMASYRGLMAISMNHFQQELDLNLNEDKMLAVISRAIEEIPWLDKSIPTLQKIKQYINLTDDHTLDGSVAN